MCIRDSHTRAIIHLISDGVAASNLGRGYILRRLIRRMVRHGRLLGITNEFLPHIANVGINLMQNNYPDLKNNNDLIFPIIQKICEIANVDYFSSDDKNKISLKIIGDHTRAVIHLISDGVAASNLGRGYILRRLIRRMVRHGLSLIHI